MSGRQSFLNQAAPENYVAGLGRGATGFTTRSDLGPARSGPSEDQIKDALAKRAAQLGAAPPTAYGAPEKKEENDEDDERFQDPENEVGLFANGAYDRDDDEADRIYQEVDEKMERRRKHRRLVSYFRKTSPFPSALEAYGLSYTLVLNEQITDLNPFASSREAREAEERRRHEAENPKIQQQFADLKRSLASVSDEDWANLPEVGDLTGKNRRTKQNLRQRFYAVPDSVIAGARDAGQFDTNVQDDGAPNGSGGDTADGTLTNFADIGAARDKVLQVRLDQAAQGSGTDSTAGTATNIDPKGYLTSLSKSEISSGQAEVGDINRVRVLLESVIKTNPKHAPGWIAAARLEEVAGKMGKARQLLTQGIEMCPNSEDIFLEAIRMSREQIHNAKVIAADAIKRNPNSVRLWEAAMDLESDPASKKRVVRKALDIMPKSVALWKLAVNLEASEADARLLLARATEEIPLSEDLWLALARLENPDNAQKVLNKARQALPKNHKIWIQATRLQEQLGINDRVSMLMKRAVQSLARESAMLKREEWIAEAEQCEEEGAVLTCGAIIRETLGYGLDEDDDRKEIFIEDAKASIAKGHYETARAILATSLRIFVTSKKTWSQAADLERNHGTQDTERTVLQKAVEAVPQAENLWLRLARLSGDLNDARRVLALAFNQNPNSENIYLQAIALESSHHEIDKARELLATARQDAGTDRVWVKSVAFERVQQNPTAALDLVTQALQLYPKAAKLWMQKGQIYESLSKLPQAREAYTTGTRACPSSVPLWLLAARLEERMGVTVKARSVLDRARLACPKNPHLWTESVRVERRANNLPQAKVLMAKALQECPASGLLWSESIWHLEPRTQRKPRSLEAIKKVDNDPILFVTVARVFWGERRLEKAASWFEKAILLDADLGDTWGWYVKFLMQHGTEEKRADVVGKCVLSEPKHGEVWSTVSKDPRNAEMGVEGVLGVVVGLLE